ncbi:MAG: hypothetical protein OXT09_10940 [Myxococcales bacterium]|nr:hypothetical protein [Myxococcales bacterium]
MRIELSVCACVGAMIGCAFDSTPLIEGEPVRASVGEDGARVVAEEPGGLTGERDLFDNPSAAPSSPAGGTSGSSGDMTPPAAMPVAGAGGEDTGAGDDAGVDPMAEPIQPPATPRFAAPCAANADCALDETCLNAGTITYCAQACGQDADCDAPAGGPDPVCTPMLTSGTSFCRLPCDFVVNESCPGGMICQDALPTFPAATGTCGFPQRGRG